MMEQRQTQAGGNRKLIGKDTKSLQENMTVFPVCLPNGPMHPSRDMQEHQRQQKN
jgi:hypothetical protein